MASFPSPQTIQIYLLNQGISIFTEVSNSSTVSYGMSEARSRRLVISLVFATIFVVSGMFFLGVWLDHISKELGPQESKASKDQSHHQVKLDDSTSASSQHIFTIEDEENHITTETNPFHIISVPVTFNRTEEL